VKHEGLTVNAVNVVGVCADGVYKLRNYHVSNDFPVERMAREVAHFLLSVVQRRINIEQFAN
jgi:hypothetical protein